MAKFLFAILSVYLCDVSVTCQKSNVRPGSETLWAPETCRGRSNPAAATLGSPA